MEAFSPSLDSRLAKANYLGFLSSSILATAPCQCITIHLLEKSVTFEVASLVLL